MKAKGQVQFLICITNCSYNFFSNGIPFHVSHSPLYKDICRKFWATGLPYASPLKNQNWDIVARKTSALDYLADGGYDMGRLE